MRVFSAPTVIRSVLGAWRQAKYQAGKQPKPVLKPTPTALAAALASERAR